MDWISDWFPGDSEAKAAVREATEKYADNVKSGKYQKGYTFDSKAAKQARHTASLASAITSGNPLQAALALIGLAEETKHGFPKRTKAANMPYGKRKYQRPRYSSRRRPVRRRPVYRKRPQYKKRTNPTLSLIWKAMRSTM